MRFSELLHSSGIRVRLQRGDPDIADVQIDSRACRRGSCFLAVRGHVNDGHAFIRSAVRAGASAVVCQDIDRVPPDVPAAVVDSVQAAVGPIAQAFAGWPGRELRCVGITGTNGKSTVAWMLRQALRRLGCKTGLFGTIEYDDGTDVRPAVTTTPDPVTLAGMMRALLDSGGTHLVMEVSSHALHQSRAAGIDFDAGVFTNLTGDHLDYHHTMAEYLQAKQRLFEQLAPDAVAVVNRDDPVAEKMAAVTRAEVLYYGLSPLARLHARIEEIGVEGTAFGVSYDAQAAAARTPMIGRHNVYNYLAALGAMLALDVPLESAIEGLSAADSVPGRLERVAGDAPFSVFVDYAHTDDALTNVLGALLPVTCGRVIVVFGCGGDRDRAKRPRMGQVASTFADEVVITSDNPRGEPPREIIDQILDGLSPSARKKAHVQSDRRKAIALSLSLAGKGDTVLIAGKGHETYQEVRGQRTAFDDRVVAGELLAGRETVK